MTKKGKIHVILTRHGVTVENQKGIIQGQGKGIITDEGMNQMLAVIDKLDNRDIDIVFCSDLRRSYVSAAIVSFFLLARLVESTLLRERDWGKYTSVKADINEIKDDPSVESDEHLYLRASMFLDSIRYTCKDMTIVIVGHGCINQAIMANVKHIEASKLRSIPMMDNAELVEFDI